MLLTNLKNIHNGQPIYIVGKGGSLNNINQNQIAKNGVIITLNEAITKIESLNLPNKIYSLQKDIYTTPVKQTTTLLLHTHESIPLHQGGLPEHLKFDNLELGLDVISFSALTAIQIGKLMGGAKFYLVSFDSVTHNIMNTFNSDVKPDYWKNYELQAVMMKDFVKNIDHEWITPVKETIRMEGGEKGGIALITPTGGREKQFLLCCKYMQRQTYSDKVLWIIVDDCKLRTTGNVNANKEYIINKDGEMIDITSLDSVNTFKEGWQIIKLYPEPYWEVGGNTQSRNLTVGVSMVEMLKESLGITDVFIIEDDDWYSENYLKEMTYQLIGYDIAGETNTIYYNVKDFTKYPHKNDRHASLFQTAFKVELIQDFLNVLKTSPRFIDMDFFRWALPKKKVNLFKKPYLSVGIKGLSGRAGIGMGHKFNHRKSLQKLDINTCMRFKELIGMDYLNYL